MSSPLILASTSPYRKALLQRLGLTFSCENSQVDETPLDKETPQALTHRLALAKARAIALDHPHALVLGGDQSAAVNGELLHKPGTVEAAIAQLTRCSGQSVTFYTAFALVRQADSFEFRHTEPFTVHFRTLTHAQIEEYVKREQPLDCAGSFKCEALGIALFTKMSGNDPTALEGLPLIALTDGLENAGMPVLG